MTAAMTLALVNSALLTPWVPPQPPLPEGGTWDPVTGMCLSSDPARCMTPIHAALLHNGNVLLWDFLESSPAQCSNCPDVVLFNPADLSITQVFEGATEGGGPNGHNIYCSGHSFLGDGRLLIRGGGNNGPGSVMLSYYDPIAGPLGTFTLGPDELYTWTYPHVGGQPRSAPAKRWYPTLTTLGNGSVLVTDGWSQNNEDPVWPVLDDPGRPFADGNPNIPAVFSPNGSSGAWNPLLEAEYCAPNANRPPLDHEWCNPSAPNTFNIQPYPFMFLISTGTCCTYAPRAAPSSTRART